MPGNGSKNVYIRVAYATLLKLAFFALLIVSVIKLWTVILIFIVAVLLAVMLDPLVGIMERHRVRRGLAIGLIALLLFGFLIAFVAVVLPLTAKEIVQLGKDFPQIVQKLSSAAPQVKTAINSVLSGARTSPFVKGWVAKAPMAGMYAAEGLVGVVLVLVITIYLLVEGRQMFEWLIAFAPEDKRTRIRRTACESGEVILAYMRGQAITCFLCGGVALTTLLILHVPAAVPLAVLAFLCDLVPVVGTIIMTAPAVLLALLVSPSAALIVVAVYLAYHFTESYLIIPRVYGKQMRLSTLTVLLAVTAGGALQGPVGAVLVLPFVAAYPIVERIWLRDRLPEDTVQKHESIEGD
ncbi:MAG TPA: AI-2E family transporter [Thermoanaerobaculia bacterium]|nr:AI-2E family transporter [Thermoanaerobaculia bacterium]